MDTRRTLTRAAAVAGSLTDRVRSPLAPLSRLIPATGDETAASTTASGSGTPAVRPDGGPEQQEIGAETDAGPRVEGEADGDASVALWKFREVVESAGHAIMMTDLDGRIEYVNAAFEDLTGYTDEEIVGETPAVLKSGAHDDAFYADLWETITGGEVWQGELVNERKDGSHYVIDQTIAPIPRDGDPVGYVAINTDITEKREREEKIETLHEATRDLLSASSPEAVARRVGHILGDVLGYPISVVRLAENRRLVPTHVNERARDLLGSRPVYEVGEGPVGRAFASEEPFVVDDIEDIDDDYDRDPVRSWLYVPVGEWGIVSVGQTDRSAFDATDVHLATILANNAATAFSRLHHQRELERENERLERFASAVSHDLRNPLQVAEVTLDEMRDFTEQLERMTSAHERMEEVIEGVLTLARQGERVEDAERVRMDSVARECWRYVTTDCADLAVETPEDGPFVVEADQNRLKHLLENLFRNAVEHGDAATVRVGPHEDGFYVADDGTGIPPERRPQIFETGYTTADDGTGLGLSIVREIADAHGWCADVTESAEGGARFEFTLDKPFYAEA